MFAKAKTYLSLWGAVQSFGFSTSVCINAINEIKYTEALPLLIILFGTAAANSCVIVDSGAIYELQRPHFDQPLPKFMCLISQFSFMQDIHEWTISDMMKILEKSI